ncbi:MAG: Secretory lipase [Marmoricola sp.]|nr:Secretory lipase [Marmoricola sp.]
MRPLTTVLATAAITLTALAPIASASAGKVPEPKQDSFYAVPSNIASYANGAVISSRKITAMPYAFPVPTGAWQIKYRTNDAHGAPTATVTTLLVPVSKWKGAGQRPVLSYQTAEDGVGDQCAPSYGIRAGIIASKGSNAAAEFALMAGGLANGWAVTVPDYEGPDSEFLAGRLEGQAVLDGVRASTAFGQGGLTATSPVGLWGYSGGAFATSIADQLQATYAPELNVQAIALGGEVAEIRKTIDDFSGSALGGALAMGVNGPLRAYPEFNLGQYLSPAGLKKVLTASDDCISTAAGRYPGLSIAKIEAFPGAMELPVVANLLHSLSPLGIAGTPTAPVYDYHAVKDELAPIGPDRELMHRYCDAGATVDHVEHPVGEHISEVVTGAPGALAFFKQRFAGQAPTNDCATIPQP